MSREQVEWRWVDERGRAMTNWKQSEPPPMAEVSDERGAMRVEVRLTAPAQAGDGEAETQGGDWYTRTDTGSVCIDWDADPKRQLSLICKRDGTVGFAAYIDGERVRGPDAMVPEFFDVLRRLATPPPSAAPAVVGGWAADDFYSGHALPKLHDDPAINAEILIQALTARLDTARRALADAAAMQVVQPALQQVKANAAWAMDETDPRRLLPRSVGYALAATPAAPGGGDAAAICAIAKHSEHGLALAAMLRDEVVIGNFRAALVGLVQDVRRLAHPTPASTPQEAVALDPQLASFYQVDSVPALLAAMEEHIDRLQESARRNVKPWEDTFPPTLLPKYLRENGLPETPAPTVVHVHTATVTPQPAAGVDEATDAARWRALIGSARVRVLGSAGLRSESDPYGKPWDGRAHIGLELWTKHSPADNEPTDAIDWVTRYADIARGAALAPPAPGAECLPKGRDGGLGPGR